MSYPQLAAWSLEAIWLIMFGRPAGRREAPKVLAGMRRAVETADLLGIPWREDVSDPPGRNYILAAMDAADPAKSPSLDPTTLIRAGCGYLAVWETLAQAGLPKQGIRVGTRRVHVSFLDIAQEVLSSAGNVSLITCYPALLRAIEKAFEVLAIESLLIPPEGGSPTATADWHSDVSRHLRDQDLEGRLFLVGAGIVGKGFCNDIKRSGGMAIDLGSMLDVWSGHVARPMYQTDEFVRRYALHGRRGSGANY